MNTDLVVLLGQGVEVLLEQNILGSDVRKDEVDLSLVTSSAATDNGTDNLEHGCDTSTTSDHAKVTHHVGLVDEGTLGALDADSLTNDEGSHELGDVALRVALDQEIEVAGLVVAGDGSVGTHNLLKLAILLGEDSADGDMLTDGEAEDRLFGWELKSVAI